MLKIYNSLHNRKETFVPLEANKVRMYVCGMTVYDYCHLGHARMWVVFDMVYRYLQAAGYEVTYVRNITDIDDKIIKRAYENAESITALTQRFIEVMHEDERSLGILAPQHEPRATEHIPGMLQMIETLIEKGYAYVGSNGDVYYSVAKFEGYGKLSGRKLEDLRAGERIAVDEIKADPLDFVLWKAAKPGEPAWESPWGSGRPGWHIECSAMSSSLLGNHFDLHGGGHDLQFPHHENEIAQSEACHGHRYVNYWMHNGFVYSNGEKMSKSLGNFFTVRDVLKQHRPEAIRYFILNSHYRSPINYSMESLDSAQAALNRLYTALRALPLAPALTGTDAEQRFHAAMQDDFNTPEAIAVLFELARDINRVRQEQGEEQAAPIAALLRQLAAILGLLEQDAEAWLQGSSANAVAGLDNAAIEALIEERLQARANKQWAESDRIRDQLKAQGVLLEDKAGVTTWRRA